jgi:hypothetical protein
MTYDTARQMGMENNVQAKMPAPKKIPASRVIPQKSELNFSTKSVLENGKGARPKTNAPALINGMIRIN